MPIRSLVVVSVFAIFVLSACSKKAPAKASPPVCFDATAEDLSAGTQAVFEARKCQGGGVTIAGLLDVLMQRRGRIDAVLEPTPDFTGSVSTLDGHSRFAIDDESDDARFCTDDPDLLGAVRRDYEKLNADPQLLTTAMNETSPLALECLGNIDPAAILSNLGPPPTLPTEQSRAVNARISQLKDAIRKQPLWCFPGKGSFDDATGALHFISENRVAYISAKGATPRESTVTWPHDGDGDPRLEIDAPMVIHLDIDDAGHIGRNFYELDGGPARETLIPGDACVH